MQLAKFIEEIGDSAAAELFQIKRRTVKAYRLGTRRPRPVEAPKIIEASGGRVDWDGIYGQPIDTEAAA